MGESNRQTTTPSRLGMRNSSGGEIVEVQGGHIVRSTGRKDRHSKVCTAKGPRDRRVRLSAHTAIQFYDVQDRLGYDRPSKAVDWLIKKAKAAIDELAELPAWTPTTTDAATQQQQRHLNDDTENLLSVQRDVFNTTGNRRGTEVSMQNLQHTQMANNTTSSFLPPSLDSDSIADTIKSFFPMGTAAAAAETTSSTIQFQNYPQDLLSRTSSHNQDLRLSLQSFQDPIAIHHHHHAQHQHQHQHQTQGHQNDHVLFSGTAPLGGFDVSTGGWSEHNNLTPVEISRFQRMSSWNAETGSGGASGSGYGGAGIRSSGAGYVFNSPHLQAPLPTTPPFLQPLFGENQFFSQRGPLQSSNTPVRTWIDPSLTTTDHQHQQHHQMPPSIHQSSFTGLGFATSGFSGFHVPTRIQGEEEHDGISDKPSSASSDSRH